LNKSHFLWPRGSAKKALLSSARFSSVGSIEDKFLTMFEGGHPVLCSSGRVSIVLALLGSNMGRADGIGVFPYASHCVLEAVSRVATPKPAVPFYQSRLRLVFHQWGYVQERDLGLATIEDCADTLVVPGSRLFPSGGAFEIWSLPKILGTTGGGVLWCRDPSVAVRLRRLRDARGGGTDQWLLRLLGRRSPHLHAWWQGAEGSLGAPSIMQTGEIMSALGDWQEIVSNRKSMIELAWPLVLPWLKRSEMRLPCVIPTIVDKDGEKLAHELGIASGMRMMERVDQDGQSCIVNVLPIPIHQEVSITWMKRVLDRLALDGIVMKGC
jgi:putative PLP-dependent aminotransferase (TIGR04422 family)